MDGSLYGATLSWIGGGVDGGHWSADKVRLALPPPIRCLVRHRWSSHLRFVAVLCMFLTYPNMNSTKNLYVNPIIWRGYFVGWRVGEISPLFAKPFPNVSPFHNSCYIFVFLVLPTVLNLTNHPLPQQPIPPHNLTQLERWSAGTGGEGLLQENFWEKKSARTLPFEMFCGSSRNIGNSLWRSCSNQLWRPSSHPIPLNFFQIQSLAN